MVFFLIEQIPLHLTPGLSYAFRTEGGSKIQSSSFCLFEFGGLEKGHPMLSGPQRLSWRSEFPAGWARPGFDIPGTPKSRNFFSAPLRWKKFAILTNKLFYPKGAQNSIFGGLWETENFRRRTKKLVTRPHTV